MSKNDITGDNLVTKTTNDAYRSGWDSIFGKAKREKELRELGHDWEQIEYILNSDESLSDGMNKYFRSVQINIESQIESHPDRIDENDVYHESGEQINPKKFTVRELLIKHHEALQAEFNQVFDIYHEGK